MVFVLRGGTGGAILVILSSDASWFGLSDASWFGLCDASWFGLPAHDVFAHTRRALVERLVEGGAGFLAQVDPAPERAAEGGGAFLLDAFAQRDHKRHYAQPLGG